MPLTVRLAAAAAIIALPLLLASCTTTVSSETEFRNGASFAALKTDGSVVAWGAADAGGDPTCTVKPEACGAAPAGSLSSGVVNIFSSARAYAALKQDGSLAVWGALSAGGDISCTGADPSICHPVSQAALSSGVRTVASTVGSFAATKTDGSVVTWGGLESGGDSTCTPSETCTPAPAGSLSSGVAQVHANAESFAALKRDGTVAAWGNPLLGGDASAPVGGALAGVTAVVPNGAAFAAIKEGGAVATWGFPITGGDFNCSVVLPVPFDCSAAPDGSLSSGVTSISSTSGAFAALKADRSVVTWGAGPLGGDSSSPVGGDLTDVTAIAATDYAFAALRSDGSVVAWPAALGYGGDPTCTPSDACEPAPAGSLTDGVVALFATQQAFAALKQDGSVVAWGSPLHGGDPACTLDGCTAAPVGSLSGGVTQIMSVGRPEPASGGAFVARKRDGSVVTWGATATGGNSSAPVGGALTGVSQVFSNDAAGAAVREDGSVATWGLAEGGGNPGCDPGPGVCSPAPPGSLSSSVIYIASPFVDAPTLPSAPTSLVATAGDGSASIAFAEGAANGQSIAGYEYSLNKGAWTVASPATTVSPVLISGLTNGTTYAVRLRAVYSRGAGPTSTSVNVTPVAAAAASTRVPALAGRTTCDRLVCTTQGRVPSGATRVTQVAAALSTAAQSRARANAVTSTRRVRGQCTIAGSGTARTYTCTVRLSRGRWAITITALKGSTVAARSVKNVRISRVAPKRAVTG